MDVLVDGNNTSDHMPLIAVDIPVHDVMITVRAASAAVNPIINLYGTEQTCLKPVILFKYAYLLMLFCVWYGIVEFNVPLDTV